jgi:pimeloyl-ACP methyl ester carboxylesterase
MNKINVKRLSIGLGIFLGIILIISMLIILGTAPLPEKNKHDSTNPFNTVNFQSLPRVSTFSMPDRTSICYREYPSHVNRIMLFIHGITGSSRNMHVIAEYMKRNNIAHGIALDMPGHGCSGKRGKLGYIGQLEDDIAEIIDILRVTYPGKRITMAGYSEGGGFAMRFAGSQYGNLVDSYIFLAPFLHESSPVNRPPAGGNENQEFSLYLPRYIGITLCNFFGITWFNNLTICEYRVPDVFTEDYTSTYSYNLLENFRPHKDYIGDIRNLKAKAVLFVGRDDKNYIAQKYIDELEKYTKRLSFEFLPQADHFDIVMDENTLRRITAKLP